MANLNPLKLNKLPPGGYALALGTVLALMPLSHRAATVIAATEQPTFTPRTRILVLIDRSGSVHYDVNKVARIIFQEVDRLRQSGDELGVAYIHEHTEANAQRLRLDAPLPPKYDESGGSTQKKMLMEQQGRLVAQRQEMKTRLRSMLAEAANPATDRSTDIWGSLSTISTFFQSSSAAERNLVFYVSDMVESMPGAGRRDFELHPPADDASALQAMARIDMPRLRKKYDITSSKPLQTIDQVQVLFPLSGTKKTLNNAMSRYWTAMFGQLGLGPSQVQFQ